MELFSGVCMCLLAYKMPSQPCACIYACEGGVCGLGAHLSASRCWKLPRVRASSFVQHHFLQVYLSNVELLLVIDSERQNRPRARDALFANARVRFVLFGLVLSDSMISDCVRDFVCVCVYLSCLMFWGSEHYSYVYVLGDWHRGML